MKKLRSLHLYLGCIFAPMLVFFAISGMWQTLGIHGPKILLALSTLHTERRFKDGSLSLGNPLFVLLVLLMSISFVITTVLGVIMALKYGNNRRTAEICLLAGIVVPVGAVILTLLMK